MKTADIVVVGGSAAGVTAAITARRHYPRKSVLLVRKEAQVLIPCGIPYICGTVGSPEKNLIPDAVLEKEQVELLVAEATAIDRERKHLITTSSEVAYDRLIVATGSFPMTASPIAYPLVNAAELAISKMRFDSSARGRREPA
jgi:NADH oxidase (H2O2-forming)